MRTIIIIIAVILFAGTWTGCKTYQVSGVNKYGTQYVVTHQGDTIYRETGTRLNQNLYPIGIINPYWNYNVFGPRVIIQRTYVPTQTQQTTPVRGSRGGRSVSTPSNSPKGSGSPRTPRPNTNRQN